MDHYFLTLKVGGGPLCTIQRLKLIFDQPLSTLGSSFKLRRYSKDAPFALDARSAAPPGVFGDAWGGAEYALQPGTNFLPSVQNNAPFGTDFTELEAPSPNSKPWLEKKVAPWENPDNQHENTKFGRRIDLAHPGEIAPMKKTEKEILRNEQREHMEAQLAAKRYAQSQYLNGGVGAPQAGAYTRSLFSST
jgi:hypothetical protein